MAVSVSVIIPVFNRSAMVIEAVDSVLAQKQAALEIIVVDDGSTDDTAERLRALGGKIILVRQPNLGVSAARNTGAARAAGEYLAFLDSDDLWLTDKLARQTAFLKSRPEALICQTDEIWMKNGRRVNPRDRHHKPSGMIFEPSLALCLVSPSAVMIENRFFREIGGFDEALPACEDYDLWLRISCRHPVYLIPEPLIIKRGGRPDQLSAAPGLDKYRIRVLRRLLAADDLSPAMRRATINTLREKSLVYAAGCEKRGRPAEAEYCTRAAKIQGDGGH